MVNRVVAGLAAGSATLAVVGIGLGYSGAVSLQTEAVAGAAPAPLPYHECPDGSTVGHLSDGDRVLLTGRDDDGSWIQVRAPLDLTDRVWIRSDFVEPDEAAELPLAHCAIDGELQASTNPTTSTTEISDDQSETDGDPPDDGDDPDVTPTTVPETTVPGTPPTTAPGPAPSTTQPPSTTPSTSPPTTSPTPTTQPRPSIGTIAISSPSIIEADAEPPSDECSSSTNPTTSVVSSTVTNADSATLNWSVAGQSGSIPMPRSGSTFTATVGPFGEHTITSAPWQRQVTLTITAVGPGGQRQASSSLTLTNCELFG